MRRTRSAESASRCTCWTYLYARHETLTRRAFPHRRPQLAARRMAERVHAWHDALGGVAIPAKSCSSTRPRRCDADRACAARRSLEKALREGKVNTNWLSPNEEHERAVQEYAWRAAELIAGDPFLARVRALGRRLSLAQLLLKLTAPGLPDVYRGDELEDLSLVDPDNRRAVDWQVRRADVACAAGRRPGQK